MNKNFRLIQFPNNSMNLRKMGDQLLVTKILIKKTYGSENKLDGEIYILTLGFSIQEIIKKESRNKQDASTGLYHRTVIFS